MAKNTEISWCSHTANLWWGCVHAGIGCSNCYAETLSKRWGNDLWGIDKPRRATKSVWKDIESFQKAAKESNEMHRVFVGSMMDIFEKPMPLVDSKGEPMEGTTADLRNRLFDNIHNYPNLDFLLLTKRASNINKYIPEEWKKNPPSNVMFGTSPVDQPTTDNLVEHLCNVNGRLFLSVEPQLDFLTLRKFLATGRIAWVINGGESGHSRRPFNIDWAKSLRDECAEFNVPFFFKQIDKVYEKKHGIPEDLLIRQFPSQNHMA